MSAAKQLFSAVLLSGLVAFASAQVGPACSRNGTVQLGDTCDSLSARYNVSTFQLASVNKGVIDPLCDNLSVGEVLCLGLVGQDCSTVTVLHAGDSCSAIADAAGIPVTTLLSNNPNVFSNCTNIYPNEVRYRSLVQRPDPDTF
ncbi:hypothetical protein BJV74DRAFT_764107 [Russula compacta]|nr:hypothetical protein BJV74DRAFT_764107 [Russula compacta]